MAKVKKTPKQVGRRNVKGGKPPAAPALRYTIKPLDSQRKCGPGTSVQLLFRVDERGAGKGATTHLVYFDKHGWYCEHGRTCPAVVEAKRHRRQLARRSRGASR